MTRRRWIADEVAGDRAALMGEHAAHLSRTLRVRVGQEFEVACGESVRRGIVASVSEDRVEFALGEEVSAVASTPITLLLAVFKFDRMEWAIEKCTELNVTSIVPVIARRTEKHLALAAEKRVERWRRIAREASEQSRRTAAPDIRRSGEVGRGAECCGGLADCAGRDRAGSGVGGHLAREGGFAFAGAGDWSGRGLGSRRVAVIRQSGMDISLIGTDHPAGRDCGDCGAGNCASRIGLDPGAIR